MELEKEDGKEKERWPKRRMVDGYLWQTKNKATWMLWVLIVLCLNC